MNTADFLALSAAVVPDRAALICQDTVKTYSELSADVTRLANALQSLGLSRGDHVGVMSVNSAEYVVIYYACAKLGLTFVPLNYRAKREELTYMINTVEAKLLFVSDRYQDLLDAIKDDCPSVQHYVALESHRLGQSHYDELMTQGSDDFLYAEIDDKDPSVIIYTSGTTGKPKGIAHTTGGYLVGAYATAKWVFDLKEDDVYWCTADIGWVTGHSYLVYGPLANGATCVMYEGAPDTPGRDRFWDMVARHRVTVFYTAPTAIRAFMKWGPEHVRKHDLSSLRLLGSVGEPINPEAWMWYHQHVGGGRCPIVDTWWQTETGSILIAPLPGITPLKPGSASRPFPGLKPAIVTESGEPVEVGGGYLVQTRPWPSMLRTIYGDHDRFVATYWNRWGRDVYVTGDGAKVDEDGYFWLLGRVDDVLNVAGHRVGTMEVESALLDHQEVAEAAVVGKEHDVKGQAICAFVTLKEGVQASDAEVDGLRRDVVQKIGAIARPDEILWTADLPKTRSGKIMRRLLRDIAAGKALGDVTTLADPSIVAQLREQYEEQEG